MRVLLGQIVSGKLTEIVVKAGFANNLRTYAWGSRNLVFYENISWQPADSVKNPVSLVGVCKFCPPLFSCDRDLISISDGFDESLEDCND